MAHMTEAETAKFAEISGLVGDELDSAIKIANLLPNTEAILNTLEYTAYPEWDLAMKYAICQSLLHSLKMCFTIKRGENFISFLLNNVSPDIAQLMYDIATDVQKISFLNCANYHSLCAYMESGIPRHRSI